MKKVMIVFLLTLTMFSCSQKFSCTDSWSGTRCGTITDIYNMRHEIVPTQDDVYKKQWEGAPFKKEEVSSSTPSLLSTSRSATGEFKDMLNSLKQSYLEKMLLNKNIPIRLPNTVLEIWIAPYEDENGDLRKPEMLYTEVENRFGRWVFSDKDLVHTPSGVVLKPEMYEDVSVEDSNISNRRLSTTGQEQKQKQKDVKQRQSVSPTQTSEKPQVK